MSVPARARVLIADDEAAIVASLEFLMRAQGYETASVADGDAALAACADFRPDLLLLDLMLPKRSGFDVCRLLRAKRQHAGMLILLVSAKGGAQAMEQVRQAGADGFVSKPFAIKELVAEVERLLSGART